MLTNSARAVALDALDLDYLGVHSAYPGHTGASEIAGTTRGNATFDAATGTPPTRSLNSSVQITIPAGETVRWVVVWSDSSSPGDVPIAVSPNGGSPKEFELDLTNNTVLDPDNSVADGDTIVFYGGTAPGGLTAGTVYYVRDRTADLFKVAATAGGSAIDITSHAGSDCVYSKIVEETFAGGGQLNVTAFVVGINH